MYKILNCIHKLTLQIIYLLTGEDYTVVKKTSGECVAPSRSGGWSRARGPITEPPPPSLIPERNIEQKILELTHKMVELLTGEGEVALDERSEDESDVMVDLRYKEQDISENTGAGSHSTRSSQLEPHHNLLPETIVLDQTNPLRMEKNKNRLSERILHLTLEIIYLLTGEDYTVVKKTSGECVAPSRSGGWSRARGPITGPPPPSLIPERNKKQKILELTHKMMELLTGEVPIRCQDVTVCFSMEEWEYVEGHKDLYQDIVMMEDHRPLTSPDGSRKRNPPERCPDPLDSQDHQPLTSPDGSRKRNPPERCPAPLDSQDFPRGDHQDHLVDRVQTEDLLDIKVEVIDEEEEEIYTMADQQYGSSQRSPPESCLVPLDSQDCPEEDLNISEDPQGEDLIDIKVEVVDDDEMYGLGDNQGKEEENPFDQGSHSTGGESLLSQDSEIEDNVAQNCSDEDSLMPNISHSSHPFSDPLHPEESSEKSQIVTQNTDHRVFKIFPCSECGRRFAKKASLFRHKRSHTRPFFCGECGKSFTFKFRLVEHQRFHTGEKPFSCPECGKCFMHRENLFKHQKIHNGERPFSCAECGKSFSQKSYLVEHLKFHMGEKPYSCSECGKPFSKKSILVKHLRLHAEEKPLLCLECGKCFTKKSLLVKHQRSHARRSNLYICSECGKCFKKKSVLVDHQRTHTGERPFPCQECGKSFTKKSVLVAHQRIHTGEKPYPCAECEKCFTQKSGLIAHQKVHEGKRKRFSCVECGECKCICTDYIVVQQKTEEEDKPFLCMQCGKCFTQKAGLVKHQRIHDGDRPFSCDECGKCFTLKDRLERHQRSHSGEKPFACLECEKCFTHKSSLVDHQRTHTGERPFPCLECGKCFIQKSDLVRHQRIHSGEKPFSCPECGKSFIHRSDLVVHQRIHTGEKLYSCPECGRGFTRKSQFEIHQRSHTGERPFTCPECGKCFNQKSNLVRHQGTHYITKATKMSLLDGITIDVPHSRIVVT